MGVKSASQLVVNKSATNAYNMAEWGVVFSRGCGGTLFGHMFGGTGAV